jgi:sugar lactone lactonase YvrE
VEAAVRELSALLSGLTLAVVLSACGQPVLGQHWNKFVAKQAVVTTPGQPAKFNSPRGMAMDSSGNVYICDWNNNAIRKMTPSGVVTTFAGSPTGVTGFGDGQGTAAYFFFPAALAIDSSGNLYVADWGNNAIRKITPSGFVTTVAGGGGNNVMNGIGTTGAPGFVNATGTAARFSNPADLALDGSDHLYVADGGNNTIRSVDASGNVKTLVGSQDGTTSGSLSDVPAQQIPCTADVFHNPSAIAYNRKASVGGATVFDVGDTYNCAVRVVTILGGKVGVTTLAGNGSQGFVDGSGTAAQFGSFGAGGMKVDGAGTVYAVDIINSAVRVISSTGVTTLAGGGPSAGTGAAPDLGYADGPPSSALFSSPNGCVFDSSGNLYVGDSDNNAIRSVKTTGGAVSTIAISTTGEADGQACPFVFLGQPQGIAVDRHGNVYFTDTDPNTAVGAVRKLSASGSWSTVATGFNHPQGVAVDSSDNVYVADSWNNRIVKVTAQGVVSTLVAGLSTPWGLMVMPSGTSLPEGAIVFANQGLQDVEYVSSDGTSRFSLAGSGTGSTGFADGVGNAALLNGPSDVRFYGGFLYVVDAGNSAIRKMTPAGDMSTYAGGGGNQSPLGSGVTGASGSTNGTRTAAMFTGLQAVAFDNAGNLYVADTGNSMIRKISPDGVVSTVVGRAGSGYVDGSGFIARIANPAGIAVAPDGSVYVADYNNYAVRKITFQ